MEKDIASGGELLERLASSDERAWGTFYRESAPRLCKLAEHHGAYDPEDVVQDVMVRFLATIRAKRLHVRSTDEIQAYLSTLVKNRVVDGYRRARARCQDQTVEFDEFQVANRVTASMIVEAREDFEIRDRARLVTLTNWKGKGWSKFVYIACVIKERPVADVARELGLAPNTVSQLKRRGIQRVQSTIDQWNHF